MVLSRRFAVLSILLAAVTLLVACDKNDTTSYPVAASAGIGISSLAATGNTSLSKSAGGTIRVTCNWTATAAPTTLSGTMEVANVTTKIQTLSLGNGGAVAGSFQGDFVYSPADLSAIATGTQNFSFWLGSESLTSEAQAIPVTIVP